MRSDPKVGSDPIRSGSGSGVQDPIRSGSGSDPKNPIRNPENPIRSDPIRHLCPWARRPAHITGPNDSSLLGFVKLTSADKRTWARPEGTLPARRPPEPYSPQNPSFRGKCGGGPKIGSNRPQQPI
ncbi:hypothetical protein L596_008383 [Steinernema carpocapsae]|uniref:Uncharacterized protein n=1 Tax=Steinernema carpocapsae TaxID=34508 RepID=A0A4U5PCB4_STECR|nr:hypothetical protein L596_008383 [Steinernema carpocapsae]